MNFFAAFLIFIFSSESWSTVVMGNHDCPSKFEGRVKEILDSQNENDIFSMSKVVFENEKSIDGDQGQEVSLNVLKNGPFDLEVGKLYKIHLRQGRLCWIEEI